MKNYKDKIFLFVKDQFEGDVKAFQGYIQMNKLKLEDVAKLVGLSIDMTIRNMRRHGIVPYTELSNARKEYVCQYCGKTFYNYKHREKDSRNIYCSIKCRIDANRKTFSYKKFRFDITKYEFTKPLPELGDYTSITGFRRKQFVNRDKINHFFFQKGIVDEKTAYLFGLFLSDGSIGRTNTSYYIRIGLADEDLVKLISKLIDSKYPIKVTHFENKKSIYILRVYSWYLYHDLQCLGCGERKTYYANYPYIEDDNLHKHFIRGVLDGDGSWYMHNGSLNLSFCSNDKLLFGITKVIDKILGITPTSLYYPEKGNMKTFCKIEYSPISTIKIRDWIYEDAKIFLQRKRNKAYDIKIYYTVRDVADACGVSVSYIIKLIKEEKIDCYRDGKRIKFTEKQYNQVIDYIVNRKKLYPAHFPKYSWLYRFNN
ncbi:helix-turn-helix domain-containing protein [Deferribacter autotrophicus]|uniref:Helix-turn-helix domain-containing protein n=1 Tax=Deferribacter autotrophicus TaxID=500465 RepID=A0A5A8F5V6_9BACT|nr:helix-turn-helix domain-containing protein [Deferribacter autotrophicus]KAA0259080.1 helix-turn-helix domain-containing protein [Deferribacter autotrophicus]